MAYTLRAVFFGHVLASWNPKNIGVYLVNSDEALLGKRVGVYLKNNKKRISLLS